MNMSDINLHGRCLLKETDLGIDMQFTNYR